ncbi:MAG: CapA family protein [Armatimonadetes bacterium]|nr:CapA family protein [Armatimonadota bacterium]
MTASLVIAGDLCASGAVGAALGSQSHALEWDDLGSVIQTADFSIVNLESPLTDDPRPIVKSGPCLWGPPESAAGIRAAGFSATSLANNHILDAGPAALLGTLEACHSVGLATVGAGRDYESATIPLTTAIRELRVSVLAFAENEFSTTSGTHPGAWPLDLADNAIQIRRASANSDFVLVLVHGGVEGYPLPRPKLQKTCRFFVEMGADAVVCHHTHVASGYESYQGRPIFYGIGNLLFESVGRPTSAWFLGYLVKLLVGVHETIEARIIPYRQDPLEPRVALMTGVARQAFLLELENLSAIIRDPEKSMESWTCYCRERRSSLLASLLCLTRAESVLLRRGLLPTARYRVSRERVAMLRSLFSCESHNESCERMLQDLLEEKSRR